MQASIGKIIPIGNARVVDLAIFPSAFPGLELGLLLCSRNVPFAIVSLRNGDANFDTSVAEAGCTFSGLDVKAMQAGLRRYRVQQRLQASKRGRKYITGNEAWLVYR